jgi:hypothetical protein
MICGIFGATAAIQTLSNASPCFKVEIVAEPSKKKNEQQEIRQEGSKFLASCIRMQFFFACLLKLHTSTDGRYFSVAIP